MLMEHVKLSILPKSHLSFNLINLAILATTISFILTVYLPLLIAINNREEFLSLGFIEVLSSALLPFLLITVLLLLLGFFLHKISSAIGLKPLVFILFFLVFTGAYFPLRSGLLDGVSEIKFHSLTLIFAISMGLFLAICLPKKVFVLSCIFLGAATGSLVFSGVGMNYQKLASGPALISKNKNVFVITFDSLEYDDVISLLDKHDNLRQSFSGFTIYENATGVGPFTRLSLPFIKGGEVIESTTSTEYKEKTKNTQITSLLQDNGYDVKTFGIFNSSERNQTNKIQTFRNQIGDDVSESYAVALKLGYSRVFPVFENAASNIISNFKIEPIEDIGLNSNLYEMESSYEAALRKVKLNLADNKKTIFEFIAFDKGLSPTLESNSANFMHFTFTHNPIMLTSDCDIVSLPAKEQRTLIEGEVHCALKKFASFLTHLKSLNLYDDSLIVFASDHGYECQFTENVPSKKYKVSRRWCLSRYKPLLMIKPLDATESLKNSVFEASLLDIPSTICRELFLGGEPCENYSGVNLANINKGDSLQDRFILVGRTKEDRRDLSDFTFLNIGRVDSIDSHFDLTKKEPTYRIPNAHVNNEESGFSLEMRSIAESVFVPGYLNLSVAGDAVSLDGQAPENAKSGLKTGGAWIRVPESYEAKFAGKTIEISILARSQDKASMKVSYSTNDVGNSGWKVFSLSTQYEEKTFTYKVRKLDDGDDDFIGFIPVGAPIDIKRVRVTHN